MRLSMLLNHLWRGLRPGPALAGATPRRAFSPLPPIGERPQRPWRRVPIALARVLDATCPLCDGTGCESCAHTGLS